MSDKVFPNVNCLISYETCGPNRCLLEAPLRAENAAMRAERDHARAEYAELSEIAKANRDEVVAVTAERDRLVAGLTQLEMEIRGQVVLVGRSGARHPCGSYFEFSGTLDRCEKCGWQAVAHKVWHWAEQLAALRRTP